MKLMHMYASHVSKTLRPHWKSVKFQCKPWNNHNVWDNWQQMTQQACMKTNATAGKVRVEGATRTGHVMKSNNNKRHVREYKTEPILTYLYKYSYNKKWRECSHLLLKLENLDFKVTVFVRESYNSHLDLVSYNLNWFDALKPMGFCWEAW